MKASKKNRKICEAIELTYSSLASHLDGTYGDLGIKHKKARKIVGGKKFHIQCVKEYAQIIKTLANCL